MKKLHTFILLSVALAVMLSASAAALTVDDISFGSGDQERGATLEVKLRVSVDSSANDVQNITLSHSADADYNVVFVNDTSGANSTTFDIPSITAGTFQDVTVRLFVALKHDAVDANSEPGAFSIGTITATGDDVTSAQVTDTATISVQAVNKLILDKARVTVDDDTSSVDDDGDDVKGVLPGDEFCVEIFAESDFNDRDDEDFDINDIDAFAETDDPDFDYDETEDLGDLGPEDDDSVQLECDFVDDETEDGDVDLTIGLLGTDDNGALHGQKIEVQVEVDKSNHDVVFRRASLEPTRIDPDDKSIEVRTLLFNRGKRDEDDAGVSISSQDLDILIERFDLDMDEGDEESVSLTVPLPGDLPEGEYLFTVRAFADGRGTETDSRVLTLTVAERRTTSSISRPTTPVVEPPVVVEPTTPTVEPTRPTQPNIVIPPLPSANDNTGSNNQGLFSNTPLMIGLLVAGIGFVLLIIIILIVVLARGNRS